MNRVNSYIRHNWRLVVTVLTFVALAGLVYVVRNDILDTVRNLNDVNTWALLLLLPVQVVNYVAQTKLHLSFFRALGAKFTFWHMLKVMLELNFVNNLFPSGGVSGISYFGLRLRQKGVSGTKSTLVQIMKFGFIFISFQALLGVGLLFLAAEGQANNFLLLVSGSIFTLLLVGTAATAFIIGSERRINAFFTYITRALNRMIRVVRPGKPETINIGRVREIFTNLHKNYVVIRSDWRKLGWPLWHAFLANLTEVLTIYVVYIAFGEWVNFGAVIIAYAVANFAGFISVLPGGVGIYEVLMTSVLAAAGVSPAVSIPVIIMYRVLSMLIQLPPGYFFYQKAIREQPKVRMQHG